MKTSNLKIIANTFLTIGTWVFIYNVSGDGSAERISAGLGAALIFLNISISDFWIKEDYKINLRKKIVLTLLVFIGIWLFVTNTLDYGWDERRIAGLGGAMTILGIILKENYRKSEEIPSSGIKKINTIASITFIVLFTFWGMQHKDMRYIKRDINSLENKVDDLENKVDYFEDNSHYH
jgi:hypothetical protein